MLSQFLVRLVLYAMAFCFIFPLIPGIHFTGELWPTGVVYALMFAVVGVGVMWGITVFSFATFGLGALLFALLFWIVPAVELKALAWLFPDHLAIYSWVSAFLAGLVIMCINWLTANHQR